MAVTKRNNATGKLKDQKNLSSKTHKKDDNINNSKKKGVTTDLHTLDILVALVRLFSFSSLFYIASTHVIALKNWPANAANKPFNTFEEFYPFYLTQHMDMVGS